MRSVRASLLAMSLLAIPALAATGTGPVGGPGRAAYVAQVGDGQVARIEQASLSARAEIRQEGSRNEAGIVQSGAGAASAVVRQAGTLNRAGVTQSGAGANDVVLTQFGSGNRAQAGQTADAETNYAAMSQTGSGNAMSLVQNGADNQATLNQTGDGNAMTATQNGAANRLVWNQNGNNLSDLGIVQSGAQAMTITQTSSQ